MTDTIFENADQATTEVQTQPAQVIPPELTEYVGEGKKYKTVEDVYKAFPNAQNHIATLEAENRAIKEELQKRKSAEELLNDIQNNLNATGITTPERNQNVDISQIVRQEIERKYSEDTKTTNQIAVVNKFKEAFGDKAETMFINIATEMGVPVESLNQLAATSPMAVFKLAGIDGKTVSNTRNGALESDVNTFKPNVNQHSDFKATVPLNGGAKADAAAIQAIRSNLLNNI